MFDFVIISLGKQLQPFWGLTIPWTGIGKGFWRGSGNRSLRIFSKLSAINGFGMPLPTTIWVGLAMLFPSAWWVVEDFLLNLNANYFRYPLTVGGIGCSVDELEKSDKAKTWHFVFILSLMFSSCIIISTMFDRLGIDRPWCDHWRKKLFSKHFRS